MGVLYQCLQFVSYTSCFEFAGFLRFIEDSDVVSDARGAHRELGSSASSLQRSEDQFKLRVDKVEHRLQQEVLARSRTHASASDFQFKLGFAFLDRRRAGAVSLGSC